ncbi:MAG: patatin-like phospholipase family protein [Candidatus Shapirobacteria bacterium]|jgi:NTE family protein
MFNRNKIGLVLGGGGARGFFHMGVIKGLQEMGVKINEISGTSIGAVIGLMYAADPKIDFEKVASELVFFKLVQEMVLGGVKKSDGVLEKFLKSHIKANDFDELKIKTRFNATDINNNQEVIFEKGRIFPGIMASISIPGVFPPLKYQDRFLVDGGVTNNIPITLIKNSNKILISDITGPIKKVNEKSLGADILYSSFAMLQRSNSLQKARDINKKIIYLTLDDDKTFILDFRKKNYQYLIDLGYKSVMERRREI